MPNNFGGDQFDPEYNPSVKQPRQPKTSPTPKARKRPKRKSIDRPPIAVAGPKSVATRIEALREQLETTYNIVCAIPTRMRGRRVDPRTISRNRLGELMEQTATDLAVIRDLAKRL